MASAHDEGPLGPERHERDRSGAPEQLAGGFRGRASGQQPREVVVAHLQHVGTAQDPPEALAVGSRIVDRGGAAVRVERDERVVADLRGDPLERGRDRLEHEPERADVEHLEALRQRRAGRFERQARRGGAGGVEAVGRVPSGVELDERQRGRVVRGDDRLDPDAVRLELTAQPHAEAVRREPPEVGNRLLEPADRARNVVRPAARMADELAVRAGHDVHERLAGYDDQARIRRRHSPIRSKRSG